MAETGNFYIYISESVITNALYITRLSGHVEKVLEFATVICIGNNVIKKALQSNFSDKEDAILYYGALEAKIEYFITRNLKDFKKNKLAKLPVLNAKDFVSRFKAR